MSRKQKNIIIRVVSLSVLITGIISIFQPFIDRISARIEMLITPPEVQYLSRSAHIVLGLTLIYFSYQLLKRKMVAWWFVVVALIILLLIQRFTISSAIIASELLLLILVKDYFKARSEKTDIRRGFIILILGLASAVAYGTIGLMLIHQHDFGMKFTFVSAIKNSALEVSLFGSSGLHPNTRFAGWFLDSIFIYTLAVLALFILSLFRPVHHKLVVLPTSLARTERLLKKYGGSSDDYFKIWPQDKSYYFSKNKEAAICYGVQSGSAICIGDPAGDKASSQELIIKFNQFCQKNDWDPCFVYIEDKYLNDYRKLDYKVIKIGEDALIVTEKFMTETKKNKLFRNVENRFIKNGYHFKVYNPPHSGKVLSSVEKVSNSWLKSTGRKEWKFVAGYYDKKYINNHRLFVVEDALGNIQAFANEITSYEKGTATIDLMRYLRSDDNKSIMDFTLMQIIGYYHAEGYKKFNLGFSPFAGLDKDKMANEERLFNLIYKVNPSYVSFQGLRNFKSKFDPEWRSKYVAYKGSSVKIPKLALAISKLIKVENKI